ncbi:hypothetical protein ACOKM3_14110 [Streptomyces sp. BH106]|uniref:hypothetical protein n=1 Tax=Streptomyces sp. BH106 TaxID=3410409 RepID=UPI003CF5750C
MANDNRRKFNHVLYIAAAIMSAIASTIAFTHGNAVRGAFSGAAAVIWFAISATVAARRDR